MKATFAILFPLTVLIASCGGGGDDSNETAVQDDPIVDDSNPFTPVASPTSEPDPITETEPDTGLEPDADPEAVTEPEAQPVTEPEPEPVTESEPEEQPSTEPEPEPVTESEPEEQPSTEPEPEPTTEPEEQPEPDHIAKTTFDGVTAYVLNFSTTERGRLQANSFFVNETGSSTDAQCRIALISGSTEVATSFISVDDLAVDDTVPDATPFLEEGLNEDSFDTVRLSGCFTNDPTPALESTSEPEFGYIVRTAFEGIEMFVLGYDFNQFGRFQVNGLVINNSSETVDAQCRLTLISGNLVVDSSFLSVDDIQLGETVPDSTSFLNDSISQDSFDRVRLSGCFTL